VRRRLAPAARHSVGLLHEGHAHTRPERRLCRGREVARIDTATGPMPERQPRAGVFDRLQVDAGGPVRRLDLEHRPRVCRPMSSGVPRGRNIVTEPKGLHR
jgi:hypothetical protein